jgi:putative membrane-bound dehydrogenase-like protein
MKKLISQLTALLLLLTLVVACSKKEEPLPPLTYTGESPRVQNPLSPEDSRRHIQVPEGFEVSLFAAEPDIINPIAFTWDERGRLWVVQSQDYPHGLANDVGGDRITICEDTNGDGKADKFTDFATEQSLSTGIVVVKGGAIVAQAPNMVFLEDSDGDDKMDKSTVLFDGFGTWDTHAGPSSLRWGVDNQIWGAVGYSGFEKEFGGKVVNFTRGVFKFSRDLKSFEPIGQFNNNTWGLGLNENFEVFGSTANNNHCTYVGIPLRYYDYMEKRPSWAINADFIQGHYEIHPVDTIPLQQVDVRGGYTAASGANFYTARNYPKKYQNQMYVCEPTGHLVHIAQIEKDGAGYKEVDGGNIFASTDAWCAPVFAETGPDGNIWVADWYNPVIQHNPDKRGMENQIWNDDKGEGNAHINPLRDKRHGRIYIVRHKNGDDRSIKQLAATDDKALIKGIKSKNMFWRTTAQRLIVEHNKTNLIPELTKIAASDKVDANGLNAGALHALWTLDALGGLTLETTTKALSSKSYAVQRAAIDLLPEDEKGTAALVQSGLMKEGSQQIKLAALLRAGELPESQELYANIEALEEEAAESEDKWFNAALKIYHKEGNTETVSPSEVEMILPAGDEQKTTWYYTEKKPAADWMSPNFNDKGWEKGAAKFGGEKTKNVVTPWKTKDIWLRRTFNLTSAITDPVLKIAHDDNYEVYINGKLLIAQPGASGSYKYIRIDEKKAGLFKKGKNVIAVYCHDGGGHRYIDVGIGKIGTIQADITFNINTVNQKMAYDKTILKAKAGQTIEINLNNPDQMPHNLVLIKPGSTELFGEMVDALLKNPKAEAMGYVPKSRYVLGATEMVQPNESSSFIVKLPNIPGTYPFICTFPGHWRMMQGVIIVEAPGNYISDNAAAPKIVTMGGGGSHDFLKVFGIMDGKIMSKNGANTTLYTEDAAQYGTMIDDANVLFICNNKPFIQSTQQKIMDKVAAGTGVLLYHPATWYNWADWPIYNKEIVGGGSKSHEKLQEFEVKVVKPNHPIMQGVPSKFRIIDELYRWKADPEGTEIEVLAIGKGLESGEEFPVVWVVKHPKSKIVGNTLGHDERAHKIKPYQTILANSLEWVSEK